MRDQDILPVFHVSDIARITGNDVRWVARQARRLGLEPDVRLGERGWRRDKATKLIVLARLQQVFGETSSRPFEILAAAEPRIEELLRGESTVMSLPATGLHVVIGIAGLAALVGV